MGTQTEHLTTPATTPPATPVIHGPAACLPTPLPVRLAQGNRGLSGKIKMFASTTVCLSQEGRIPKWTLWSQGMKGLRLLQGRGVPRKEKIGQASFFPVSSPIPCGKASFSRGCPIGRWKHLCKAVLIHRRERAPGLWPVLEGERLFQSALHSEQ